MLECHRLLIMNSYDTLLSLTLSFTHCVRISINAAYWMSSIES